MHQFFVESSLELHQPVLLPIDVLRQIKTVLKLKPYERVWLSNQRQLVEGILQPDFSVIPQQIIKTPSRSVQIVLYASLIRKERFEWMLQKATELGVDRIVPLIMERNVVKWEDEPRKLQRYSAILKEASEQCHRIDVPQMEEPLRLKQTDFSTIDTLFVAYEQTSITQPLSQAPWNGTRIGIIIGPEGGISPLEFELLVAKGAIPVGLGPRILRAETAALVALSTLNTRFES